MTMDITSAYSFLAGHARLLDRRRFEVLVQERDVEGLSAALDAYRNPDGGYGWGIEPDLRSPESQPVGAMHALEVFSEIGPPSAVRAVELCDWLAGIALPGGALPFTLPVEHPAACSPIWLGADHDRPSLQMTAQVTANALRVASFEPRVADHPWLAQATGLCVEAIRGLGSEPHAYELLFAARFVHALSMSDPATAEPLVERLALFIPSDGVLAVEGGVEGEALRALDLAPRPGVVRELFADHVVSAEMDRLGRRQQPDGGWPVDFESSSTVASLEWRGYATVAAVMTLSAG